MAFTREETFSTEISATSRPVAVQGVSGQTAKLKDGLTYRFAGDSAGMNAHASDHAGFGQLRRRVCAPCRSDGSPSGPLGHCRLQQGRIQGALTLWVSIWKCQQ
jgi:hypothetical protein